MKNFSCPGKFRVPALAFCLLLASVPAEIFAEGKMPYDPAKALLGQSAESDRDRPENFSPKKKRSDALALSVAPEYFFDFGSDLPGATGWGASVAATAHFNSATPKWDFVGGLELLAFSAESETYTHGDREVKETLQSANILLNFGLNRQIGESFVLEAMLGLGIGLTYGEVKGDNFKTSSSGNWTTTFSAKILGEYRLDENWGVFAAYRFAYISPSIASKIADWHNLDLLSQSIEFGVRYRF